MRRPDDRDVGDGGVCAQYLLHLRRRYVLAAGDDDVLQAAGEEEPAVGVAPPEVPGVQPAVPDDGGRGRPIAVIPRHDGRSGDDEN